MHSVFEPAVASFAPSRQHYESLPTALLQNIFAQLLFKQKMNCEAVCSGWRSVLRCTPFSASRQPCDTTTAGVWGTLVISLQRRRLKTSYDPPRVLEESPYQTRIILYDPDDPFRQPDAGFVAWLRLRATLASKFVLDNEVENLVWAFSDLILAIHDSCTILPAKTPLTMVTGTSCFRNYNLSWQIHCFAAFALQSTLELVALKAVLIACYGFVS